MYELLFGLDEAEIPSDDLIEGSGEKQIDVLRVEDDTENSKAIISILQTLTSRRTAMWTLVLFTLLANTNSGGGMSANVTTLHFTSQQFCLEAEKTLEAQGVFANSAPASYQIFGKCIGSATVLK